MSDNNDIVKETCQLNDYYHGKELKKFVDFDSNSFDAESLVIECIRNGCPVEKCLGHQEIISKTLVFVSIRNRFTKQDVVLRKLSSIEIANQLIIDIHVVLREMRKKK